MNVRWMEGDGMEAVKVKTANNNFLLLAGV